MVERHIRVVEVACSNHVASTRQHSAAPNTLPIFAERIFLSLRSQKTIDKNAAPVVEYAYTLEAITSYTCNALKFTLFFMNMIDLYML